MATILAWLQIQNLLGLDYEIHYKLGLTNKVANALSCKLEVSEPVMLVMTSPVLNFADHLRQFYATHMEGQALFCKWHDDPNFRGQFTHHDGLLFFKERLLAPLSVDCRSPCFMSTIHPLWVVTLVASPMSSVPAT